MIVGVGEGGVGVVHTAVVLNKLSVLILTLVLLGAHEQHVLEEVRGAVEGLRVQGAAHVHVQGGS